MSQANHACPHCRQPVPDSGLEGLCPACLLRQGAAYDTCFSEAFAPPSAEDLQESFPHWEILELIGAGGMGAVYKARQRELDRIVALKILPPGIGDRPGFAARFTREAKALAKLSHPGIVTIHDSGRMDGLYFLLMEYVDGLNLRQLIENGRISSREALAIVPSICDALQYAHDNGIVHRDIKPENILLDRQGRVKVADFGLVKLVGVDEQDLGQVEAATPFVTEAGHRMGTPHYMAPEQTERPADVDHRADIYSLGIVLYQMLTGELPGKPLEPPSKKVRIDVRLDEIVLRALEKNPEHRYQQASHVKKSVETIITSTHNHPLEDPTNMEIKFNCPECNQKLSVDESAAGAGFACPACSTPLVVPSLTPVPAPPPPALPAQYPGSRAFPVPGIEPPRARALAIWALVLGIIGIVPMVGLATGLIALLLGSIALFKKSTSKGLAIAGTILGALASLMIPLHLALFAPVLTASQFASNTMSCASNMQSIATAIASYRQKHGDSDPPDLETLVKEGLLDANALQCPFHIGKGGGTSYSYFPSSGRRGGELIAWDQVPHRVAGEDSGRMVMDANLTARFLPEDQFRAAPKATKSHKGVVVRSTRPGTPPTDGPSPPTPAPPSQPVQKVLTVASAIDDLKSTPPSEIRPLLTFLMEAPVADETRDEVIAAVEPLLNDVDAGAIAFDVFGKWAGKEQVPKLVEMLRIAPNSQRGKQCMKLLSRMEDARAAEPLAACLTDFHILRDAKAALAALGDIAKPAVLPYYHHEDRSARDAARELLRGYQVTEEETFAESIKTLESGSTGARQSAMFDLPRAKLTPDQQAAAARAIRPLVTDSERALSDPARHAMKTLATPADADFLLNLLDSTDDATRQFATDLLVKYKEPRAAQPIAVLLSDSHKTHQAGRALIALGSAAEPAVVPYLRHDDPTTRKRAAEVLAEIGTAASLPALKIAANDKDFFARVAAERAMNTIKSRPSGAVR